MTSATSFASASEANKGVSGWAPPKPIWLLANPPFVEGSIGKGDRVGGDVDADVDELHVRLQLLEDRVRVLESEVESLRQEVVDAGLNGRVHELVKGFLEGFLHKAFDAV